jgi:S1-C subfamily serine protease
MLIIFTLLAMLLSGGTQDLAKHVYASTALLYRQTESGGMDMTCTATAFEKTDNGYLFATASHCVGESDSVHERVEVTKTRFYLTFDEKDDKKFYPAKLVMAGYQPKGDDFSIFSVETDDAITITPLGDEHKDEAGLEVVNVASPNGLGKQIFHGFISSLYVDRPVVENDINWQGVMLLQIQSGPGSSGSAIVSVKQEAIIGFLVGHFQENTFVMPVSRFNAWRKSVEDGTYPYFKKDAIVDAPVTGSKKKS